MLLSRYFLPVHKSTSILLSVWELNISSKADGGAEGNMDGNPLAGKSLFLAWGGDTMRPEPGTPHGNGQELNRCTMPFLLILSQVTGRDVHQWVSYPTQACPSWPAIHGNIYSGFTAFIFILLAGSFCQAILTQLPSVCILWNNCYTHWQPEQWFQWGSSASLLPGESKTPQKSPAWPHCLKSITWSWRPQALFCGQIFLQHCKGVVHS